MSISAPRVVPDSEERESCSPANTCRTSPSQRRSGVSQPLPSPSSRVRGWLKRAAAQRQVLQGGHRVRSSPNATKPLQRVPEGSGRPGNRLCCTLAALWVTPSCTPAAQLPRPAHAIAPRHRPTQDCIPCTCAWVQGVWIENDLGRLHTAGAVTPHATLPGLQLPPVCTAGPPLPDQPGRASLCPCLQALLQGIDVTSLPNEHGAAVRRSPRRRPHPAARRARSQRRQPRR